MMQPRYKQFICISHLLLAILLISPNTLFAQPVEDSSSSIEISDSKPSTKASWDKHFQGVINFTYTGAENFIGGNNPDVRGSAYIKLGYEDTWGPVKLVLQGRYLVNTLRLRYSVLDETEVVDTYDFILDEQTDELDVFLREAYLQFAIGQYTTLTLGKQIHTFGQFDILSPIDFLLPFDVSDRSIKFSKIENRLPQLSAKLSFYTLNNVEINFIYFPTFSSDTILEFANENRQPITAAALYDRNTNRVTNRRLALPTIVDPPHENTYVLRVLNYAPEITYGFTIYSGFSQFPGTKNEILPDNNSDDLHIISSRSESIPILAFGFELAKLIGDYEFKFEILYYENLFTGFNNVELDQTKFFVNDVNYYESQEIYKDRAQDIVDYFNWIRENNYSRLYLNTHNVNLGLGFNYTKNDWFVSFSMIIFMNFTHPNFEKGIELLKEAFPEDGLGIGTGLNADSIAPVPVVNFYRSFPKGTWEYQAGLGFGFLTVALGISQYHTFIINENLKLIVAIEALIYFADFGNTRQATNDVNEDSGRPDEQTAAMMAAISNEASAPLTLTAASSFAPALRLALSYSF